MFFSLGAAGGGVFEIPDKPDLPSNEKKKRNFANVKKKKKDSYK